MSNVANRPEVASEVASEVVTTVPQNIIVRLTGETATERKASAVGQPKPALALQLRCYNEAHALISAATKLHNERKEQAKLGN